MRIGEILRREALLACQRMALRVGWGADPTPRVVERVRIDHVERRRLESEGHEALIHRYPRLLDVAFDLIALGILREQGAECCRASAMRLQTRRSMLAKLIAAEWDERFSRLDI